VEESMMRCFGLGSVFVLVATCFAGCEREKEPVLRIETPRAKVEVDKSPDGSSVEIRTERERDKSGER
jgi:hypothetical protein